MSESGPSNKLVSPLFRNKLTWIGFAIPFVIGVLVALRRYLPGFPAIQLSRNARLLDGLVILSFAFSFAGIGFAYLVNLEISFSVWFFGLLGIATVALMRLYSVKQFFGLPLNEYLGGFGVPDSPLIYHLGMGAMLCMVAYGLWIARDHLRDVFAKAFGRAPDVDDSQEILSYRKAVFGLLSSVIVMLVWLCWAGMALWLAIVFLALAFALFYGLSRVVAEGGVAVATATGIAPTSCVSAFGVSGVGKGALGVLALSYIWASDLRTFVMAPVTNGLKAVEDVKKGKKRLLWAIFLAIAITFVFSLGLVTYQAYRTGGINMYPWFFRDGPQVPLNYTQRVASEEPGVNTTAWALSAVGAGLMLSLLILRRRCVWWPLHPIGLVITGTYVMSNIWFSFFLGWCIKWILVRYGGPGLYRKCVPLFLGMILGQCVSTGMWVAIDFAAGVTGNVVFSY